MMSSFDTSEVVRFRTEGEARLLAGRLVADGLPAELRSSGSLKSSEGVWYIVAVAPENMQRARTIAAEDLSHLLESEFPGVTDDRRLCARCSSASLIPRPRSGLLAFLARLLLQAEIREYRCAVCGHAAREISPA